MVSGPTGWSPHLKYRMFIIMTKLEEHGLSPYVDSSKKMFSFTNFQWVVDQDQSEPGKTAYRVARSSQPQYTSKDRDHTLTPMDVSFLRHNRFSCVLSANECNMDEKGKQLLRSAGIAFYNFKIRDMHAPTPSQMERAIKVIEHYSTRGAVLVFCGYGQGRTGTYVAGWAMKCYLKSAGVNVRELCNQSYLGANFGVERAAQVQLIRATALDEVPLLSASTEVGCTGNALFGGGGNSFMRNPFASSGGGFQPPHASGSGGGLRLSGINLYDDDNFSFPKFANFNSSSSTW